MSNVWPGGMPILVEAWLWHDLQSHPCIVHRRTEVTTQTLTPLMRLLGVSGSSPVTLMTELMKTLKARTFSVKRVNCYDKARNGPTDSFVTGEELIRLQEAFLPMNPDILPQEDKAERKRLGSTAQNKNSFTAALGHRASFLLTYSAAVRGESTRKLEFSDLSLIEPDMEGTEQSRCHLLILTLGEGKTNKYGHYDRTAIMRHRDVQLCTQGALALYFFCLFHCQNHPFPSMQYSRHWFFRKVLQPLSEGRKGKGTVKEEDVNSEGEEEDNEEERYIEMEDEDGQVQRLPAPSMGSKISDMTHLPHDTEKEELARKLDDIQRLPYCRPIGYQTQTRVYHAAFKRANIVTTKVTHFGRAAAASTVSQYGSHLDDAIRRHGHWNKDVMSNCYFKSFRELQCSRH